MPILINISDQQLNEVIHEQSKFWFHLFLFLFLHKEIIKKIKLNGKCRSPNVKNRRNEIYYEVSIRRSRFHLRPIKETIS